MFTRICVAFCLLKVKVRLRYSLFLVIRPVITVLMCRVKGMKESLGDNWGGLCFISHQAISDSVYIQTASQRIPTLSHPFTPSNILLWHSPICSHFLTLSHFFTFSSPRHQLSRCLYITSRLLLYSCIFLFLYFCPFCSTNWAVHMLRAGFDIKLPDVLNKVLAAIKLDW